MIPIDSTYQSGAFCSEHSVQEDPVLDFLGSISDQLSVFYFTSEKNKTRFQKTYVHFLYAGYIILCRIFIIRDGQGKFPPFWVRIPELRYQNPDIVLGQPPIPVKIAYRKKQIPHNRSRSIGKFSYRRKGNTCWVFSILLYNFFHWNLKKISRGKDYSKALNLFNDILKFLNLV